MKANTTATRGARLIAAWPIIAAVAIAGALLFVFWAYVPLNMDEFVAYQTLACFYHPNGYVEAHCFPCTAYYLKVLGMVNLPLLSYDYIGSLSSLLYAPLFVLWPDPTSARATGILALAVQAWFLARMFRCRAALAFCGLCLFLPYSFVHIADTGPVAFQTTSIFAIAYLLKRWRFSRRPVRRALLLSLAGALIGCGFWVKPTFFFASGGIAVLAGVTFFSAMLRPGTSWVQRAVEYLLFALCAVVPTLLIYQAQRASGDPYLGVLGADYVPSQIVLPGMGTRFRENVLHFVLNPLDATAPCFNLTSQAPDWGKLACVVGISVLLSGLAVPERGWRHRMEIALLGALFVLSLALVATNIYAKSMHHAVLAYPFIIMAAMRCIDIHRRATMSRILLGLFVIMNACLFFRFPAMYEKARTSADAKAFAGALNAEVNANWADDSVVLCADWGLYFIKRLYGPRSQIVLSWCIPGDESQLLDAIDVARGRERNLVVTVLVGNTLAQESLQRRFPRMSIRSGGGSGSPWRICTVSCDDLRYAPVAAAPTSLALQAPL